MNIILIGFMGAGKTTVGRKLANRLGYFFLDTDQQIEKQQGCTIEEIFRYAGEATFRDLETKLLGNLQNVHNTILSTGGGMFLRSENQVFLKGIGKTVYLQVDRDTLEQRLQCDLSRPLLQKPNWQENVNQMLQQREPAYLTADLTIEAQEGPPNVMVSRIIEAI
jgi:shikimate kinase